MERWRNEYRGWIDGEYKRNSLENPLEGNALGSEVESLVCPIIVAPRAPLR